MSEPTITVLLVDDHEMFSQSLAEVLGQEPDIEVLGTSRDLAGARARTAALRPDVVLLDQRLPDGRGVEHISELKRLSPGSKIVVLTGLVEDGALLTATEAGCSGFLDKSRSVEELVSAVRAAAAGEVLVSPALLGRLLARLQAPATAERHELTQRELEVLTLVGEGLSNSAIAERLGVSVHTVRNHVANVLSKLDVHSKLEALSLAHREGLLPSGSR